MKQKKKSLGRKQVIGFYNGTCKERIKKGRCRNNNR